MIVEEALQLMTKSYLHRVIDSFTKDLPKGDEEKSRDLILRNVHELTDVTRVSAALTLDADYSYQVLLAGILEAIVDDSDHSLSEVEIIESVVSREKSIIMESQQADCLRYQDGQSVAILTAILEVALEDERLTRQELNLIDRLREKLSLSLRTKHLVLARLEHYPRSKNEVHTPTEFREALIDLQRRGIVFYCNKLDGGRYVIPDELAASVRQVMGFELSPRAWRQLLTNLSQTQLAQVLETTSLPKSGTKEVQQERIVSSGIKPSQALGILSNQDLYELCRKLPGANVSGTKEAKIERIIEYFSSLVKKDVPDDASPGELYYKYLVELASRNREALLANKIISKDIEIERRFEEGTRFLFTDRLGLDVIPMSGTDHADGGFRLTRSNELLLWDNKSKEAAYAFPPDHLRQFKRYIRDSLERVTCFLIITTEPLPECEENALRLKVDSGSDTDVAVISAENLVWVAENWTSFAKDDKFDPEIFNHTGILTRQLLKMRMKLFL